MVVFAELARTIETPIVPPARPGTDVMRDSSRALYIRYLPHACGQIGNGIKTISASASVD